MVLTERDNRAIDDAVDRFLRNRGSPSLSRRRFLAQSLGVVAAGTLGPAFLSACAPASSPSPSAVVPASGAPAPSLSGVLSMLCWDGYDDAKTEFTAQTGVTVNPTYMSSNDDIFTKLRGGGMGSIDVVTPFHGYIMRLQQASLLQPIDYSRLPNASGYFPRFLGQTWNNIDGQVWSAPFIWGTDPFMWNPKYVSFTPTSYLDMLKPEYKGKVVMTDDMIGHLLIFPKVLGYDPQALTQKQLDETIDWLVMLKKDYAGAIATGTGDQADILSRGDGWFTTVGGEMIAAFAAAKGVTIKYTHTKEGDFTFCDQWAIAKDAPDLDNAYAWIDLAIGPEAQAAISNNIQVAVVNKDALPLVNETSKGLFPYDNLASLDQGAPMYVLPAQEAQDGIAGLADWTKAWERWRAG